MTTRYASDVAQKLVDEFLISEEDQHKAFEIIEDFWKDYAMDVWDFQNVVSEIINRGLPFSRAASREILTEMEKNLDSDQGFNWDTLHNAIQKWEKRMSHKWLSLPDTKRAEFSEETCAWAVIPTEKHGKMTVAKETIILDANLSLLDAVEFLREMDVEIAKNDTPILKRKWRLFAVDSWTDKDTLTAEIETHGTLVFEC